MTFEQTTSNRAWHEEAGVIYFYVTSYGTSGPQWISQLEADGFKLHDRAKCILRSSDFKTTSCGTTTKVAVIRGTLFKDKDRVTKNIRTEADRLNFSRPNGDLAGMIRKIFSDEELDAMGLWWIVAMHDPINDSDNLPRLLIASRSGEGSSLVTDFPRPEFRWGPRDGFAFVAPQV
jgi:hypothetical protein